MRYPLQKRLERLASDRWARRSLRTLLRAAWLGLSLLCIGLGLRLLLDLSLSLELLGALALTCVAIGAALLLRRRLSARDVARRLDNRFGLHEQLTTALEISTRPYPPEGVELNLLEQAAVTTTRMQQHIARRRRNPWPEIAALGALALLTIGLVVLLGLGMPFQRPAAEPLPELVAPPEVGQQPPPPQQQPQQENPGLGGDQNAAGSTEVGEQQNTGVDQQSAEVLADALRDQSATREAAESLDQNDPAAAAQSLRELADQSDQLSAETRGDLADELSAAADQIEPINPELAQQLRDSAYGLQQEGRSTAEALESLADAVAQLGSSGPPQQQAQQGQQQPGQQGQTPGGAGAGNAPPSEQREQQQPSERLGVDGVPLELESEGDQGQVPTEGEAETTSAASGGGFQPGEGEVSEDVVQIGADPLRIPVDLRDVVQEYFTAPPEE
jgi:hypothetical protein